MTQEIIGTRQNLVLEVDLSSGKSQVITISENDRKMYLGGKGLGLKLLEERLRPGTDPLSEENILIIMTAAYMNSGVPCSARFVGAVTKSPLTGIILSSSCGGPFGRALKKQKVMTG